MTMECYPSIFSTIHNAIWIVPPLATLFYTTWYLWKSLSVREYKIVSEIFYKELQGDNGDVCVCLVVSDLSVELPDTLKCVDKGIAGENNFILVQGNTVELLELINMEPYWLIHVIPNFRK